MNCGISRMGHTNIVFLSYYKKIQQTICFFILALLLPYHTDQHDWLRSPKLVPYTADQVWLTRSSLPGFTQHLQKYCVY